MTGGTVERAMYGSGQFLFVDVERDGASAALGGHAFVTMARQAVIVAYLRRLRIGLCRPGGNRWNQANQQGTDNSEHPLLHDHSLVTTPLSLAWLAFGLVPIASSREAATGRQNMQ